MNVCRPVALRQGHSHSRTLSAALLFGLMLVNASFAHADMIFNVNTVADQIDQDVSDGICQTSTGACSLRAAIMQANHLTGPITTRIKLPAGHYLLSRPITGFNGEDSGDLNFTVALTAGQSIVIEGVTAATTVIDANQIDSVMSVAFNRFLTLSRVTIRGGFRAQTQTGGIYSEGSLTLLNCIIESNSGNVSPGGITSYGSLRIYESIFRFNTGSFGGALFAGGFTTIRNSSLYGNAADYGGAIAVAGTASSLYVINSTISGNTATANGGGIDNEGDAFLYNTSIIGNDADHDHDPMGGKGGGVYVVSGMRFVAVNSLISKNTLRNSPDFSDCEGELEVYGWNLLGDFTGCSFSGNGVAGRGRVSGNTIGPLSENGGPTPTHALLAGSEAIDTTTAQGCIDDSLATLATDQRGAARVAGLRCDVGAFEYDSVAPTADLIFRDGFDNGT